MKTQEEILEEIKQKHEEYCTIEYRQMHGNPYAPDYAFHNYNKRILANEIAELKKQYDGDLEEVFLC